MGTYGRIKFYRQRRRWIRTYWNVINGKE